MKLGLTWKVKQTLRVFQNKLLRRTFGTKEMNIRMEKSKYKETHNLHASAVK